MWLSLFHLGIVSWDSPCFHHLKEELCNMSYPLTVLGLRFNKSWSLPNLNMPTHNLEIGWQKLWIWQGSQRSWSQWILMRHWFHGAQIVHQGCQEAVPSAAKSMVCSDSGSIHHSWIFSYWWTILIIYSCTFHGWFFGDPFMVDVCGFPFLTHDYHPQFMVRSFQFHTGGSWFSSSMVDGWGLMKYLQKGSGNPPNDPCAPKGKWHRLMVELPIWKCSNWKAPPQIKIRGGVKNQTNANKTITQYVLQKYLAWSDIWHFHHTLAPRSGASTKDFCRNLRKGDFRVGGSNLQYRSSFSKSTVRPWM